VPVGCGPLQGCITLFNLRWKDGVGDRRVLRKDGDRVRAHNEIANETLVIFEIARDPDAAVNEEENGEYPLRMLGFHDVDLHFLTIPRNGLIGDGHTRSINGILFLKTCERSPHLRPGKGPEEGDLAKTADAGDLARFVTAVFQGMTVQAINGASLTQLLRLGEIALRGWPK